jgi:hypothetical protein
VKRASPQPEEGQFGQVDIERPRLRFRQNGDDIPLVEPAQAQDVLKAVNPFCFDAVVQHQLLLELA